MLKLFFNRRKKHIVLVSVLSLLLASFSVQAVRVKNLARIEGVRTNLLTGYGVVVGLAGSGDSRRSMATQQSIMNALLSFGVSVSDDDIVSRNAAAVLITAELPPFAQIGDRIDVVVSSLGDARSLVGGTLLLAPLQAVNGQIFALSQGQISVGGFKFDMNGNVVQKNHPTVGIISNGGIIEKDIDVSFVQADRHINLVLNQSDFTTANRLVESINNLFERELATAIHAGRIQVKLPVEEKNLVRFIAALEGIEVTPDNVARVVINERTGTIVSGGNVVLQEVTISHGNIKLTISTDYAVSQPSFVTNVRSSGVRSIVVPDTQLDVDESIADSVNLPQDTTIADLVTALRQIKTSTRDIIVILQAIKAAGSLHAELVVQ